MDLAARIVEIITGEIYPQADNETKLTVNIDTRFKRDLKMKFEHFKKIVQCVQRNLEIDLSEFDPGEIKTVRDLINLVRVRAHEQGVNLDSKIIAQTSTQKSQLVDLGQQQV